jgi:hypothetical protein
MLSLKPFWKSKTLWWILASVVVSTAQPIGVAIEKRQFKPSDIGGLIALLFTSGMAAYSRSQAVQPLGLGDKSTRVD